MVGGQLHDEGGGLPGEGLELLQNDPGDDDRRHADEVGGGGHQGGIAKQGSGEQANDGHLGPAGDKAGGHDGHLPVPVLLDGPGGHDAGHAAAGGHQHGDEGLAAQAKAAEDPVHDEGDAGHVADVLQNGQQQEEHQHLGYEAQHGAHAAHDAAQNQVLNNGVAVNGGQAVLDEHRDARHPYAVLGGVGLGHREGLLIGLVVHLQHIGHAGLVVIQVGLVLPGLVGLDDGAGLLEGAGGLIPGVGVGGEGDEPAVAEQAVIGPVGKVGADGDGPAAHGQGIYQGHNHHEDGQGGDSVGDHPVDLVRQGQPRALLPHAGGDGPGDVLIPLVGDDGLRIIVQGLLTVQDGLLHLPLHVGGQGELAHHLFVPLKHLDGVPPLHPFGKNGAQRRLDGVQRLFHQGGIGQLDRGGLPGGGVLGSGDEPIQPLPLQRGYLYHRTAQGLG